MCKAVARGADEKNRIFAKAQVFLKSILKENFNSHSFPLTPYRGARFNILFHNSSIIYCLHEQLHELFEVNQTNMLLRSVFHDMEQDFLVAEVRDFAILSKTVMAPLWNILEKKDINMTEMNGHYQRMVNFFDSASEDPTMLMRGESPFGEEFLRRNAWWDKVFQPNPIFDGLTVSALAIMVRALALFSRKHFADHLAGGKHSHVQPEECRGVPKHNKLCQRAFGLWDHVKRNKPNMCELASEAFILFTLNNTAKWLSNLDNEMPHNVITEARKATPAMYRTFKIRQAKMEEERKAHFREQQEEKRRREEKQMVEMMSLVAKVEEQGGLWKSEEALDAALMSIQERHGQAKGKQLDALKVQMAYRKKVLHQPVKDPTAGQGPRDLGSLGP
jgi:hypothetical protein